MKKQGDEKHMRKKAALLSILLFSSFSFLIGCKNNKVEKILLDKHYNIDSMIYIDNNDLLSMHNKNQDFVLFVYSDCGCGGHTDLVISSLQEYIKESNSLIYSIESKDYKKLPISLEKDFPLWPSDLIEETKVLPWLNFYKDGKLTKKVNYEQKMETIDGLNNIISKYAYTNGKVCLNTISPYTHINFNFYKFDFSSTSLLDEVIKENPIIEYTWKECSDCFAFKKYERELFENFDKKLYYFEVDYFRCNENKDELWEQTNAFPYKYQFASYRGGKVPCFINYINGIKDEMSIFRNDVIKNGIIEESFYEELINKKMDRDELDKFESSKVLNHIKRKA